MAQTPNDIRTDRQILLDIEQRDVRIETKLSRLLEAQGLSADGRKPVPPRSYKETLPLDLNLTQLAH